MDNKFRIEEVAIVKGDRGEQLLELYSVVPEEWFLEKKYEHVFIEVIETMIKQHGLKYGVVMGENIKREKMEYFDFDLEVTYCEISHYDFDGVVFTIYHAVDQNYPLQFLYVCNDEIKKILKEELPRINHASVTLKFRKCILQLNRINLFHCKDSRKIK
ncbi:hypothetical protein PaeCFBP13512_19745 [Paenibacillus sp. CFBP13512]|uniref:hypothetical protein n=1 Tax=Paenibacillus sp. CFBP13512 TaxID=2184007 RepID=UPI0010C0E026|nr:hypothetical protein [Paenibacillus sp. CFBP13512]TKJ86069.1 hypothetical protein PaeCFBP13512_19745 [Paenibacillus sp. CFBP13512]